MTVFGRAWQGLTDFWREFNAGPNNYVPVKGKALKKKSRKRQKLPIIKEEPVSTQEVKHLNAMESREKKLLKVKRPPDQFEKDPNWNTVLVEEKFDEDSDEKRSEVQSPRKRTEAIEKAQDTKIRKSVNRMLNPNPLSRNHKHLLFMNPGSLKIMEAVKAAESGSSLPVWARPFQKHLSVQDGILYYEDLEVATKEVKREQVKLLYYDPKGASTILPITDTLRESYANITKRDVRHILRTLETYQINFRRRLPPKIQGRMILTKPGVIMMDTFFPSKAVDGWRGKYPCLCCMDAWSRFSRVYVLANKTKSLVQNSMEKFLAEFASLGHLPRMILSDKGSELKGAAAAIEKYRKKPGNLVHNSVTGQPVLMVENMQSQYQRRMAVFRTASLTDDPSAIMDDISDHLNNQKRPNRGGLTPLQLLSLKPAEIKRVNEMHVDRAVIPDLKGLPELLVGHHCRVLLMTRKEQLDTSQKGFRAKWSRKVYTVLKKTKLQLNPSHFRYYVGSHQSYYRHELLYIPKEVDREVIHGLVGGEGEVGGLEYDPDESDYNPDSD